MAACGNKKNENFKNSIVEQFDNNNNNDNTACPYPTSPEGFTGYVLDFGMKLLTNAGLFGIIFLILFVRQNYFDAKWLLNFWSNKWWKIVYNKNC